MQLSKKQQKEIKLLETKILWKMNRLEQLLNQFYRDYGQE